MTGREHRPAVERVKPPDAAVRIANVVLRRLLASPLHRFVSGALLLLHVRGRRTGRVHTIPVSYREIDGRIGLISNSTWRLNLRGGADVEVTLRGRRRPAHATLIEDPERVATTYARLIDELGVPAAQRRLGIRVNVDRTPTHDELSDAIRASGLSIVLLDLR